MYAGFCANSIPVIGRQFRKRDLWKRVKKIKTIDLVAEDNCVLAHESASINFAVLFLKPMIFLITSKVRGGYYGQFISNFSCLFDKTPFYVDSILNIDIDKKLAVDNNLYSVYKENHITRTNSPEKFFGDIVADCISLLS